jgi:hypothetical protein
MDHQTPIHRSVMQNPLQIPIPIPGWRAEDLKASHRTAQNFFEFIRLTRIRKTIAAAAIATVIQLVIFKCLYPYPDFFSDSYAYIYAASANLDVSIWPIGYSKFLAFFHHLTSSATILICFQYLLFELGALYFFTSCVYLFHFGKTTSAILFLFLFLNPLFLYLCNYVSSDPLFLAVSMFWLTEILWTINKPRSYQIITQAILLLIAFTIRNNAYVYPIVSIFAFLVSRRPIRAKILGSVLGPVLLTLFILNTKAAAKQITGTPQFSFFTGWQLANNALYIRDKITIDSNTIHDPTVNTMDRLARAFLRKYSNNPYYRSNLKNYVGNFFIKESRSPLKYYFARRYPAQNLYSYVTGWGKASADFDQYGSYIISAHPAAFIHFFAIPNLINYLKPPLEKLELYNLGNDTVNSLPMQWFDLPGPKVHAISQTLQGSILFLYPSIFFALNVLFVIGLIKNVKNGVKSDLHQKTFNALSLFLVANVGFCIVATIIVFRYEIFPMVVLVLTLLLLLDEQNTNRSITHKPDENASIL